MADLAPLLKRLEAVTTRLEAVAGNAGNAPAAQKSSGSEQAAPSGAAGQMLEAYSELTSQHLSKFLTLSSKIGGLVQDQVCPLGF